MAPLAHVLISVSRAVILYRLASAVQRNLLLTGFTAGFLAIHGLVPLVAAEGVSSIEYDSRSRDVAAWFTLASALAFGVGVRLSKPQWTLGDVCARVDCKPTGVERDFREKLVHLLVWSAALGVLGLIMMARAETDSISSLLEASRFEFRHSRASVPYLLGTYLTGLACAPPVISFSVTL